MKKEIISHSIDDTQKLAKKTLDSLEGNIITLSGQLGSGKTTFAQGIGQALGIKRMTSPTYILLRQYSIKHPRFTTLYHADLYRLTHTQEILDIGLPEIWENPKNLLLIEWPEKILLLLPKHLAVRLQKNSDNTHTITF